MNSSSAKRSVLAVTFVVACVVVLYLPIRAEDGYRLWMRYDALTKPEIERYRSTVRNVVVEGRSPTLDAARSELRAALTGMFGNEIPVSSTLSNRTFRARASSIADSPGFGARASSITTWKLVMRIGSRFFSTTTV